MHRLIATMLFTMPLLGCGQAELSSAATINAEYGAERLQDYWRDAGKSEQVLVYD